MTAAADRRARRVRRADRAAVVIITLGGLSVVVGVLGILLFIAAEALPLFRGADLGTPQAVPVQAGVTRGSAALAALKVDEYQRHAAFVTPAGRIALAPLSPGRAQVEDQAFPGLQAGAVVTASASSPFHNVLAAATADGQVALAELSFVPTYRESALADVAVSVRPRHVLALDPLGRPIRQVSYFDQDGVQLVAGLVSDTEIALWRTSDGSEPARATVAVPDERRVTHVRVGRHGAIAAGTEGGRLFRWSFDTGEDAPRLSDRVTVGRSPVTALEFLIGGNSLVVGLAGGELTSWFRATSPEGGEALVMGHRFAPLPSDVVAVGPSPRDRSFVTAGADGGLVLYHQTSEQVLASQHGVGRRALAVIAPKADALFTWSEEGLHRLALYNPHPEVTWRALFGAIWYEGYARPEYVWQSSGGTDDFEPKLSLVPLMFGTIKGTLYALLFAVPIAILAALYTSQFVHPSIKAKAKPAVEIMAALPSVVIGFLAGLYLAAVVERHLVGVMASLVLLPLAGTSGLVIWQLMPRAVRNRARAGSELLLIVPLLAGALGFGLWVGPSLEGWLFAGDAKTWIQATFGLTYDQRNCLVVGLAMGFAVIPIIFTIAEDAFSSVPSSLTAASLAVGASRWQTALRVVVPTASPGVFSAVMIGFGRAVGETMIVLMATGNTPVMEWSMFNGIRTLSANIAVEIPEAPYGGTLYRTLFLAAAVLFTMTFLINTLAEIIRQRLRERYKAI
jgi:phosphate transport system permease protein